MKYKLILKSIDTLIKHCLIATKVKDIKYKETNTLILKLINKPVPSFQGL